MKPALAALRDFASAAVPLVERCELCGAVLAPRHRHLFDVAARQLRCSCTACALLFPERPGGALQPLERCVERLDAGMLSAESWTALGIPVGLAWLTRSSADGHWHARMPGALGPVASRLDGREALAAIEKLPALRADVEALLVRRGAKGAELYRVSIDVCAELAGLLRRRWQGFGGGDAHGEVERYFAGLRHESA